MVKRVGGGSLCARRTCHRVPAARPGRRWRGAGMPWHVVVRLWTELPGYTAGGATELGSHLPTWWMCRPWKPGVSYDAGRRDRTVA